MTPEVPREHALVKTVIEAVRPVKAAEQDPELEHRVSERVPGVQEGIFERHHD